MNKRFVLQEWLGDIPIRMQSTLVLSLRGPDTHSCTEVKKIIRWMRGLTFVPGNPANVHEFMGPPEVLRIPEKSPVAKELEFCSQHFYSHLMHGLEVLAYRHPDDGTRGIAYSLFWDLCNLMHLPVEPRTDFEFRLKQIDWDVEEYAAVTGSCQPGDGKEGRA